MVFGGEIERFGEKERETSREINMIIKRKRVDKSDELDFCCYLVLYCESISCNNFLCFLTLYREGPNP